MYIDAYGGNCLRYSLIRQVRHEARTHAIIMSPSPTTCLRIDGDGWLYYLLSNTPFTCIVGLNELDFDSQAEKAE